MSGIEGAPVIYRVPSNNSYEYYEEFPESGKEGEPDEYVPALSRMGELSPSSSPRKSSPRKNAEQSPISIAKRNSYSLSEQVDVSPVIEPGSPAFGSHPGPYQGMPSVLQNRIPHYQKSSRIQSSSFRDFSHPSNLSFRGRAPKNRQSPDVSFTSLFSPNTHSVSGWERLFDIEPRSNHDGRMSRLPPNVRENMLCSPIARENMLRKSPSSPSIFSPSSMRGNVLIKSPSSPSIFSHSPIGSPASTVDRDIPVEQQLRRMRKTNQRRKNEQENLASASVPRSNSDMTPCCSGSRLKRRSYGDLRQWNPYKSRSTTPSISYKDQNANDSLTSIMKPKNMRRDTLDRILDSIKPLEENPLEPIQRATSDRASSMGDWIQKSKSIPAPISNRYAPIEFSPKQPIAPLESKSNEISRLVSGRNRSPFSVGDKNKYTLITDKARSQFQNERSRKQYQPPLEMPSFSSTNPFKHDPDWSKDPNRYRQRNLKRAVKQKPQQVPSPKISDNRVRQSKTSWCYLCKVRWNHGDSIVRLPCMHVFHRKCISAWLQNTAKCPLCRMSLRKV